MSSCLDLPETSFARFSASRYELPVCVRDVGLFEENRCRPGDDRDIIVGAFAVDVEGVSSSGRLSTFVHFPEMQAHGIVVELL